MVVYHRLLVRICINICKPLDIWSRKFCRIYLPLTKKEVNTFARVCLSVCLLARLLKNACMDLHEMLRVERCRDVDELINF